jgi:hypothetical protein
MPGETSRGTSGDSRIIDSRRFGSPLTRDNPEVGIVTEGMEPNEKDVFGDSIKKLLVNCS